MRDMDGKGWLRVRALHDSRKMEIAPLGRAE